MISDSWKTWSFWRFINSLLVIYNHPSGFKCFLISKITSFAMSLYICVGVGGCPHAMAWMWSSEEGLLESGLSYQVDHRNLTQVIRLGGKHSSGPLTQSMWSICRKTNFSIPGNVPNLNKAPEWPYSIFQGTSKFGFLYHIFPIIL